MSQHRFTSRRAKRVHAHKKRQRDRQAIRNAVSTRDYEKLPLTRKKIDPVSAWW